MICVTVQSRFSSEFVPVYEDSSDENEEEYDKEKTWKDRRSSKGKKTTQSKDEYKSSLKREKTNAVNIYIVLSLWCFVFSGLCCLALSGLVWS